MEEIKRIKLNKNRGWRGLAELIAEDDKGKEISKMIFSFSQDVWDDMRHGFMVIQDTDNYIILNFDNVEDLPKSYQQRSVLIKNFVGSVIKSWTYSKSTWGTNTPLDHYDLIYHFTRNNNKHTTSDWNCIGIRVTPSI